MKISENVRIFRTKSGFSQQELAKRIGVSQQMIFAIEKGFKVPSIAVLQQFHYRQINKDTI
ncbi:MAG: helix-turn-helix transcriptional regulator [Muribaculaceae bacterium]|nr:helix-turn-helix transcriptional regulator [Alistipes senegalensis]MCM1473538.1 helix-turn-helix transcriptional regulator [Muribaculaceae bacterium]